MPALTAAELEALGVAREVAANARMTAAGFVGDAAAYERDANRRSKLASDLSGRHFTSAVDQEIDANRRAREAEFLNAAVKENPAAAAPGTSIYSTDPFIDPRSAAASANNLSSQNWVRPSGGGLLNYAVPSFRSPAYEDWTRFMPTDFQLAEFGGMHYQPGRRLGILPSDTSTTGTSGVGTRYTPTYTPNTGVNTGVNTGGTKYAGVKTGSDKEKDLDAGRTHHVEMYDDNDMWVGAEGTPGKGSGETRDLLGATQDWSGAITANPRQFSDPYGYDKSASTNQMWDYLAKEDEGTTTPLTMNQLNNMLEASQTYNEKTGNLGFNPLLNEFSDYDSAMKDAERRKTAYDIDQMMKSMEIQRMIGAKTEAEKSAVQEVQSYQEQARVRNIAAKQEKERLFNEQQAAANRFAQNVNKTFMEQFSPTETTTMGPINLNVPLSPASTPFQEVATAQNMGVNQGLIDQAAQQRYMSSLDDEQARNMRAMAQGRNIGQVMRDIQTQQALANLSAAGGMEMGGGGLLGEIDPNIDISPGGTVNVRGQ